MLDVVETMGASDLDLLKGELSRVRCSPDRTVMSRTWSV